MAYCFAGGNQTIDRITATSVPAGAAECGGLSRSAMPNATISMLWQLYRRIEKDKAALPPSADEVCDTLSEAQATVRAAISAAEALTVAEVRYKLMLVMDSLAAEIALVDPDDPPGDEVMADWRLAMLWGAILDLDWLG